MLNLLLSLGLPLGLAVLQHGPLSYAMSPGLLLLILATLAVLAFLLLAVPLWWRWRLPRGVGLAVLGLYLGLQALFILVVEEDRELQAGHGV